MESCLKQYFGVTNFIWLEGSLDEDITDAHIDGTARFYDEHTLLTVAKKDFLEMYDNIQEEDYDTLMNASNAKGEPYKIIKLPVTALNVQGLDYKGSYLNYYSGNEVVLLPVYGDENDGIAFNMMQELFFNKTVIPINVTAVYKYGGMLHCVTQQQPICDEY